MAMAPTAKVILGSIAFGIFWILAVFPSVPCLPIGRTAGSLLGAMLMVVFRVMSPQEAYDAIDLSILGLLFGTMVVSIFLEKADMFKYLGKLLAWKSRGAKDLLFRICLISAIASALFTNDTCCVILTQFVLKIARQNNLPPQPFLLALASSSNIGSSATPIGNPQNLVIAVQSGIPFWKFLSGIILAMLVGVFVNAGILLCYFWNLLSTDKNVQVMSATEEIAIENDMISYQFSPALMHHLSSMSPHEFSLVLEAIAANRNPVRTNSLRSRANSIESNIQASFNRSDSTLNASKEPVEDEVDSQMREDVPWSKRISKTLSSQSCGLREETSSRREEKEDPSDYWKKLVWKSCVYLITLAMLTALLMGVDMSWTTITAALALVILDFKDAVPCFDKVSYSLLIFFCGMFITVEGFNRTGITSAFWDFIEPYAQINSVRGLALLSIVILVFSNVASNVPTVLLLGGRIAASAALVSPSEETRAWLILAWVSTVAGNLSLLGSAANLIVCEQAQRAKYFGYNLSFYSHLRFGVPSTLIVTAIGLLLVRN